jgi:hypothetical protein
MTKSERQDLDLRVLFADTNPDDHPLRNSTLLQLIDQSTTTKSIITKDHLEFLRSNPSRKAPYDFSYALEYAYNSTATPYIALFEGDVMFAEGWLARTVHSLRQIAKGEVVPSGPWLDLRLFNNEGSIGWESKSIFGNNIPLIILIVSSCVFSLLQLLRYWSTAGYRYVTSGVCAIICMVTVPLFIVLFYQSGKSSLLPPSPGTTQQQWGCCTQGVVIPRSQVLSLISALRDSSEHADIIFIEHAKMKNLNRYVLNPVQLQHLGILYLFCCE